MLGLDRFGEILRFYVTQVIFTERSSEFTSADIQSFKHLGREHVGHWLSSDLRTDVARAFLANFTVERGKARQCASADYAEPTARDFTDALHRARFKEFGNATQCTAHSIVIVRESHVVEHARVEVLVHRIGDAREHALLHGGPEIRVSENVLCLFRRTAFDPFAKPLLLQYGTSRGGNRVGRMTFETLPIGKIANDVIGCIENVVDGLVVPARVLGRGGQFTYKIGIFAADVLVLVPLQLVRQFSKRLRSGANYSRSNAVGNSFTGSGLNIERIASLGVRNQIVTQDVVHLFANNGISDAALIQNFVKRCVAFAHLILQIRRNGGVAPLAPGRRDRRA